MTTKLTKVRYTAARTGQDIAVVPGVGPVKKGQEIWLDADTADSYATELEDGKGGYVSDYTAGESWSGSEDDAAEKLGKQSEAATKLQSEQFSTAVDAHPIDPDSGTVEEYAADLDKRKAESIARSQKASKLAGAAQTAQEAVAGPSPHPGGAAPVAAPPKASTDAKSD